MRVEDDAKGLENSYSRMLHGERSFRLPDGGEKGEDSCRFGACVVVQD
jgi:hypothetical protein